MFGSGSRPGRVVSMSEGERTRRLAPLRLIESHWRALRDRAGGAVPHRDHVDPRCIQDALEYAFLGERIGTGIVRLRVTGGHLDALMGMDATGLPISSFLTPACRDATGPALESVFADPAVVEAGLEAERRLRQPQLSGHLLLLPLRSDTGRIDRLLGGLVTFSVIGHTPRRFDAADLTVSRLSAPARPSPDPLPGRARNAAPIAPRARNRTHLRLVVSND